MHSGWVLNRRQQLYQGGESRKEAMGSVAYRNHTGRGDGVKASRFHRLHKVLRVRCFRQIVTLVEEPGAPLVHQRRIHLLPARAASQRQPYAHQEQVQSDAGEGIRPLNLPISSIKSPTRLHHVYSRWWIPMDAAGRVSARTKGRKPLARIGVSGLGFSLELFKPSYPWLEIGRSCC